VTSEHIFEVFEHLVADRDKTILMVTHDKTLVPRFTRTFEIMDGALRPIRAEGDGEGKEGVYEHARV
jgi:ABC-type lipoprotein export system ATPase subunit